MRINQIMATLLLLIMSLKSLANNQCFDNSEGNNSLKALGVISVVFEYPIERGMLNPDAISGFTPISSAEDKNIIRRLSKNWLNSNSYQTVSDSFFKPLNNQVISQSREEMQQEKDRFLDQLRTLGRKDSTSKVFIYSGHGVQCYDSKTKVVQWCLALPMRNELTSKALRPIINDPNVSEPIFDKDEEFLVTEEQVIEATQAKMLILDSCHSNQATQFIQTKKINQSMVVISSSLTPFVSYSEKNKGGLLLRMLDGMTKLADTPHVCAMDLNGDGQISVRENLLTMQLGLLKKERNVNFKNIETFISENKTHLNDKNLSNRYMQKNQIFSGVVDESCFIKISPDLNCAKGQPEVTENNKCQNLNLARKNLNDNISALLKNDDFFNNVSTLLKQPAASQTMTLASAKAIGTKPGKGPIANPNQIKIGSQAQKPDDSYVYDRRMQEASKYISDWEDELSQEENMCSMSEADTCNIRSDRGRLFKSIKDLLAIGLK